MSHNNDVESFQIDGLTVRIAQDTDYDSYCNPRDNDNLGVMVCWHRSYKLGDDPNEFSSPQDFQEWADSKEGKAAIALILPLYLYDHSGITMNTSGFSCSWDSGQVGYIYITRETIRKEYSVKRISKQLLERVRGYLVSEVEEYDSFLRGEVYGYIVENADGDHLDSCWGFIGDIKYVKEEATSAAKHEASRIKEKYAAMLEREATSAGDVPLPEVQCE